MPLSTVIVTPASPCWGTRTTWTAEARSPPDSVAVSVYVPAGKRQREGAVRAGPRMGDPGVTLRRDHVGAHDAEGGARGVQPLDRATWSGEHRSAHRDGGSTSPETAERTRSGARARRGPPARRLTASSTGCGRRPVPSPDACAQTTSERLLSGAPRGERVDLPAGVVVPRGGGVAAGPRTTKPWMSTGVPPGGTFGAQPLARKLASSSTWIAFRSAGSFPTIDGSMRAHVRSPSLLILLHWEDCTRWRSSRVGTPDTGHRTPDTEPPDPGHAELRWSDDYGQRLGFLLRTRVAIALPGGGRHAGGGGWSRSGASWSSTSVISSSRCMSRTWTV